MVKQTKRKATGAAAMGAGPGRPKGSTNKVTVQIKDMVSKALDNAGGVDYLVERANDPRTAAAFLGLVGKVLPIQLTGEDGEAIKHSIRVSFG
jgi:hypothetical protein